MKQGDQKTKCGNTGKTAKMDAHQHLHVQSRPMHAGSRAMHNAVWRPSLLVPCELIDAAKDIALQQLQRRNFAPPYLPRTLGNLHVLFAVPALSAHQLASFPRAHELLMLCGQTVFASQLLASGVPAGFSTCGASVFTRAGAVIHRVFWGYRKKLYKKIRVRRLHMCIRTRASSSDDICF